MFETLQFNSNSLCDSVVTPVLHSLHLGILKLVLLGLPSLPSLKVGYSLIR